MLTAGRSLVHCNGGSAVGEAVVVSARRGSITRFTRGFAAATTMSDSKAVNVVVKGTVQGVFFRMWTVDSAKKLGLQGWVRNLQDGTVEAVFAGPSSAVDSMVQQCHSGPSAARVSSVDVSPWDNDIPQGFEKR